MKYIFLSVKFLLAVYQRALYVLTFRQFPPPLICVSALIQEGNRLLLIDRSDGLGLGLPGGYMSMKETVEETAVREVREETGLEIEVEELLTVVSGSRKNVKIYTTDLVFRGKIVGSKETRNSAEGKCVWTDIDRIDAYEFAHDHLEILQSLRLKDLLSPKSG